MSREPVLVRVDGTPSTGYDSIGRCLTLAAALQRRRRPTHFVSQIDPSLLAFSIKRAANEWIEADGPVGSSGDLEDLLREIRKLRPVAVIVDSPNATEEYLRAIVDTGVLVVSMDNLATTNFPSHVVVNPTLGPTRDAYEFEPGTQLLLGSRYAVVRPEVRRMTPIRSQEPQLPFRVMVALGDDDPNQQVARITNLLVNDGRASKIDLVARGHHPNLHELRDLAEANKEAVSVATEAPEVASRLVRAHMAITSGNNWSLELACVGVPQLIIVQREEYWPTAQRLEEEGAAICLGWHENVSDATILQAVNNLMSDPLERKTMMRYGRKLIDGRGPDRFVTALEVMLSRVHFIDSEMAEAA